MNPSLNDKFDRTTLEQLLQKRFFYQPSNQIYGGIAGLYDYGPIMCLIEQNLLSHFRQHFILNDDLLENQTSIITPYEVLKNSGHVDKFKDFMVKDLANGNIYRADHFVKQRLMDLVNDSNKSQVESILAKLDNMTDVELYDVIEKYEIKTVEGNKVTKPVEFNLMFQTNIGPTGQIKGFLRPETAQGQFLNFKKLKEYNNEVMPFGSCQIGKSFRNEISPRSGLLRVREFTMAEIEYFIDPLNKKHEKYNSIKHMEVPLLTAHNQQNGIIKIDRISFEKAVAEETIDNETLAYFMARIYTFLIDLGIAQSKIRFRQHMKNEMAHYACDCWDAELLTSYGWIECVGCADRSAYDLKVHSEKSNEVLSVKEQLKTPITCEKLTVKIINKKKFGLTTKKDSKLVEQYFANLGAESIGLLAKELNDQHRKCKVSVQLNADANYELDNETISITKEVFKQNIREYIPNVIEPSFGIGRIIYSLLEHSFYKRKNDEQRIVLKFNPLIAPYKCVLLPISNNIAFKDYLSSLTNQLKTLNIMHKTDSSSTSIGRRYARNDELGIPFALTVDFESLQDNSITLRERDSLTQIRDNASTILNVLTDLIHQRTTWEKVILLHPVLDVQLE